MTHRLYAAAGHLTGGPPTEASEAGDCDGDFSLKNPRFLAAVCEELKRRDKQGTGLVTADKFNAALADMNVKYGTPEADLIMRYCQVTDDGYVLFKELMLATYKYSKCFEDNVAESIASRATLDRGRLARPPPLPQTCKTAASARASSADALVGTGSSWEAEMKRDAQRRVYTPEITDAIRRLYAQWDRSCLRDWQFKQALQQMDVTVTPEFEKLLSTYGPSGSVTFSQVLQALMTSDSGYLASSSQRKSRSRRASDIPLPTEADRAAFYEPRRNPVTWAQPQALQGIPIDASDVQQHALKLPLTADPRDGQASSAGEASETCLSKGQDSEEEATTATATLHEKFGFLKKLVALYLADRISSTQFRRHLVDGDVPITSELDSLIRAHEADNGGHFTAFVVAVFRAAEESETYRGDMRKAAEEQGEVYRNPRDTPYLVTDQLLPAVGGPVASRRRNSTGCISTPVVTVEEVPEDPVRMKCVFQDADDERLYPTGTRGSAYGGKSDVYLDKFGGRMNVPLDFGAPQHESLALASKASADRSYYGHGDIISWGKTGDAHVPSA
ncbi:hypothetical protein BESB_006240 [Besnoitia besnoiti]|uniref:Uncharacterized protein n=1 Tax=Besnoitia besnoiti TaxID=94643 RepID=A0A2A9MQ42_BESBE|nr:hypothetical protein BESB_006240 [Besnoitia besnoiti]PFH38283.1 hypothetical protein BESB_006240 [Besnoitia besnoiti]